MFLSPDILNTILKYIKPNHLQSFFKKSNIDFSTRFTYNAKPYNLTVNQINQAFSKFPHIIIPSLTIHILQYNENLDNLKISTEPLLHLTLISRLGDNCNPSRRSSLSIFLKKCPLLVSLIIKGICINNLNLANTLFKLRELEIHDCSCRFIDFTISYKNLQQLKLYNFKNNLHHINFIEKCTNLTRLELTNCNISSSFILSCTHLHTFRATNVNTCNGLAFLKKCPNLQILELYSISNLIHLDITKRMPHIQSIIVFHCNKLRDVNSLELLTHLKCIKLCDCSLLTHIPPKLILQCEIYDVTRCG